MNVILMQGFSPFGSIVKDDQHTVEATNYSSPIAGELAIVSESTLDKLMGNLAGTSFYNIKNSLITRVSDTTNMTDFVNLLADEHDYRCAIMAYEAATKAKAERAKAEALKNAKKETTEEAPS